MVNDCNLTSFLMSQSKVTTSLGFLKSFLGFSILSCFISLSFLHCTHFILPFSPFLFFFFLCVYVWLVLFGFFLTWLLLVSQLSVHISIVLMGCDDWSRNPGVSWCSSLLKDGNAHRCYFCLVGSVETGRGENSIYLGQVMEEREQSWSEDAAGNASGSINFTSTFT